MPLKNREMVPSLMEKLAAVGLLSKVILSTNDPCLQNLENKYKIKVRKRPKDISDDTASMKLVLLDLIEHYKLDEQENIMTLYPTYPERTYKDICEFSDFFIDNDLSSALCKKDIKTHPFMCLIEDGIYAAALIKHKLYRRQDYPKCFEMSHFICACRISEVKNLNDQLYNEKTGFFYIPDKIDVDHIEDYEKWEN